MSDEEPTQRNIMTEHREVFNLLNQADRLIDQIDARIKASLDASMCVEGLSCEGTLEYDASGRFLKKAMAQFLIAESETLTIQSLAEERLELCVLSYAACQRLLAMRRNFDVRPEFARGEHIRRRLSTFVNDEAEVQDKCFHPFCPLRACFVNEDDRPGCVAHYDKKKE